MTKKQKLFGVRGKLLSAVCMLLVAVIMVVSSTYAWFVLSTAPEVKGITTAIGANGALEMALKANIDNEPLNGLLPENAANTVSNKYWGNLVDLTTGYGLENITLYPAQLNEKDGKIVLDAMLFTPVYGADGRVSAISTDGITTGLFNANGFYEPAGTDDTLGVRAVGKISGLTDRETAFRTAMSAANSAKSSANSAVRTALQQNGSTLADLAIGGAMGNTTVEPEQLESLKSMVTGLESAIAEIETSYKQFIVAYAASADVDDEELWSGVKAVADTKTLAELLDMLGGAPDGMQDQITALDVIKTTVTDAKTALDALEADEDGKYAWADVRTSVDTLVDTSTMTVNGTSVDDIKNAYGEDKDVTAAMKAVGDLQNIVLETTDGAFSDIANYCGEYSAMVTLESVGGLKATISVKKGEDVETAYLDAMNTTISAIGAKSPSADEDKPALPISDYYGYVLDLAFRTNAASSNLLLQQNGVDRIYSGNDESADTMGGGSTMSFTYTADFGSAQVATLMSNVRIVFFDTASGEIIVKAKLDTDNVTIEGGKVIANIYLYTMEEVTVEGAEGEESTTTITEAKVEDNVITALTQNEEKDISVLVYLDGETISNKEAAALADISGNMNLQFASSAELKPMDYSDLKTGA